MVSKLQPGAAFDLLMQHKDDPCPCCTATGVSLVWKGCDHGSEDHDECCEHPGGWGCGSNCDALDALLAGYKTADVPNATSTQHVALLALQVLSEMLKGSYDVCNPSMPYDMRGAAFDDPEDPKNLLMPVVGAALYMLYGVS